MRFLTVVLTGLLWASGHGILQADEFQEQIAPLLAARCLSCHNDVDHKGDFSLQTFSALNESGYVVPGEAKESHLLTVLTPQDGKRPSMPKNGDALTAAEVATLRKWIDNGAKWPSKFELKEPAVQNFDWWSFQPLQRPPVPKVNEPAWVRTPIDAFILQKLKTKGLTHSTPADRRTLIRRVTYDLIGLPPTPAEVDAFVESDDPRAYEKLVDRLLASSHYGERWGRHWLDVVKYADTCGYDKDKLRPKAWPYRDYVIRSFNEDKPYSQFVQEQLAGDVLFPGKSDGILGLGFLAAGPWDFIGHVEVPESKIDGKVARHLDRDEMVSNTLNTFCSLTVQCARCHNHKFDPITQEHYYSLQTIFAAVDRAERVYDADPKTEQRRQTLSVELAGLQKQHIELEQQIQKAGGEELARLKNSIAELKTKTGPVQKGPEFGWHSAIVAEQDTRKWVEVDLGKEQEISQIVLNPCHDEYAGIGAGFGFPVRYRVQVSLTGNFNSEAETVRDHRNTDVSNPRLSPVVITMNSRKVRFIRVTATKLAVRSNDYIFALAELQALDESGKNFAAGAKVTSSDSIEAPVRWRRTNLTDGIWAKAGDPQASEKLRITRQKHSELMKQLNTPERISHREEIQKRLAEVKRELKSLPAGQWVYAAATEFKTQGNFKATGGMPREIRLLHRGNVQQPGEVMSPGVLAFDAKTSWQLDLDSNHTEADRRAALARWITSPDHPLTWRSIVNRVWLYHFGQGLVTSPNDFGRMGQLPTHPELLDWLAVEFRDNGQSFKKLHRMIVFSSVYQQASDHHSKNATIDGSNQFLWRMNRRRLEAEEIRDSVLAVSGRLNPQAGGPGFYLFQLEKTAHSPHYEYHKFDPADEASHRRSVYRFIVRSQPDPYMTTLDCADSSQSTPARGETLTSLQALSLLNNRFNLVMAEHFATRLQNERNTLPEQITLAMQLVTGRKPTTEEQIAFENYTTQHGLPNLCRLLFNLSEFLYLD